jgi:hypothetical protein
MIMPFPADEDGRLSDASNSSYVNSVRRHSVKDSSSFHPAIPGPPVRWLGRKGVGDRIALYDRKISVSRVAGSTYFCLVDGGQEEDVVRFRIVILVSGVPGFGCATGAGRS